MIAERPYWTAGLDTEAVSVLIDRPCCKRFGKRVDALAEPCI